MAVKKLQYYAGGQWLDSKTDKYMDIYNPSTGEVIAQTPCCTKEEVNYAVECAKVQELERSSRNEESPDYL